MPYSGTFEFVDKANNIKEIRQIHNGVRDGITKIINLQTNKVIEKEKYIRGFKM